jgi:ABC-type multidrug transport system ATPase subunit
MLELHGLTRRYGDLVALDDLSFTVAEGQMFGFVGPNGAGKTTAMRIILGVLAPDAGEVRWRGQPINDEIRRRVGYMPEDHGHTFSRQFARLEAQQQRDERDRRRYALELTAGGRRALRRRDEEAVRLNEEFLARSAPRSASSFVACCCEPWPPRSTSAGART